MIGSWKHQEGRKNIEKNESMLPSLVFAKLCLMVEVKIITFAKVVHSIFKINI